MEGALLDSAQVDATTHQQWLSLTCSVARSASSHFTESDLHWAASAAQRRYRGTLRPWNPGVHDPDVARCRACPPAALCTVDELVDAVGLALARARVMFQVVDLSAVPPEQQWPVVITALADAATRFPYLPSVQLAETGAPA